jgi:endonuclease/exonuclease/phosphatase family metal-dependent hydrolase
MVVSLFNNENARMLTHLPHKLLFTILLTTGLVSLLQAQSYPLWQIQGNNNQSPFLGQRLTTTPSGVTAVGNDFFILETLAGESDNDPSTSDGLIVYTSSRPDLSPGDIVVVSGTVREIEGMTNISGFDLSFERVGSGATLPPPVLLDDRFPSKELEDVPDLETVEGMRVSCSARVIAPTTGRDEIAGLTTADERPLREAGIEAPGIAGLPVWDGNPEIFWIDPNALGGSNNRFLGAGMEVEATGPLIERDEGYILWPNSYQVSGNTKQLDLRPGAADEVTIASFNVLNLTEDSDWLDVQFPKLARYVVERLGGPDIVALQEVGSLTLLNDLNFFIDQLAPELNYRTYLIPSSGRINLAYLIRDHIQVESVRQLGNSERLSTGGRLHDRPPLLLEALLPTQPSTPVSVLNLHVRSLNGIEGSDPGFVRRKRYEQALSIARMVQDRQAENLIVLGDYNALPYTDGYVDVVAQIGGTATLGAEYPVTAIVQPPLTNSFPLFQALDEQYSFVFRGSAQQIDHCLTNDLADLRISELAFARGNADASYAFYTNPNIATRASDHDGLVLYLRPNAPFTQTEDPRGLTPAIRYPNPYLPGAAISWPAEWGQVSCDLFSATGQLLRQWTARQQTQIDELVPGCYYLQVQNAQFRHTLRLLVP